MGKNERKQRWLGHLLVILTSMVLLTSWSLCGTYAKYTSEATATSTARVAKFEVDVTNKGVWKQETGPVVAEIAPGEKIYYKIEVTNKSEVSISCQLSLKSKYEDWPLTVSITDKDKNELSNGSAVIEPASNTNFPQTHTYYACISWDENAENAKDASNAGKTDLVSIIFEAVQAD